MKTGTQIQIEFSQNVNLKDFIKWFKKEGYDSFINSKLNKGNKNSDMATCLATDEETEWGYYLELQ